MTIHFAISLLLIEIQGSDGTPYNGGSFRLEINVPERYVNQHFTF